MNELDYLKIINKKLTDNSFIGDDCAFLPVEFLGCNGLHVTQDSLVQDVHFSLDTTTPYLLGRKSVCVNLSDLAAVCATPLCITISLSLPKILGADFVSDFYRGANEVCEEYGVKIVGGDLTGADKVFISVCAIGAKSTPFNITRANARVGDAIVTTGVHGDSAGGLMLLSQSYQEKNSLVMAHLNPSPQLEKSKILSRLAHCDFAMMDTSDGLGDALFKLAQASGVNIECDFSSVPVSNELTDTFPNLFKTLALWGGEDYQLLFSVSDTVYEKLDKTMFFKIGRVLENSSEPIVFVKDTECTIINERMLMDKSYNHFGEKN